MLYGFITRREEIAIAALLIYAVYMSRERERFKPNPKMWGQIESAAKVAARRARREAHMQGASGAALNNFLERLKPRLACRSIQPRHMSVISNTTTSAILPTGELVELKEEGEKSFWNELLEDTDPEPVLRAVQKETGTIVGNVRERIERERALRERGFLDETTETAEAIELEDA